MNEQKASGPMSDSRKRPLVLIVEGDPDLSDHLQQMLGTAYSVECASDVPAAITYFAHETPDAVLLNCQLPPRDGIGKLLATAGHARSGVVLMCGDAEMAADLAAFFQYPCLCKPLSSDRILSAVHGVLRNKTTRLRTPADPHASNS